VEENPRDVAYYSTYFSINSSMPARVQLIVDVEILLMMILDWDESGFRNSRREQNFKAGGVGFSRKPRDQKKNSCSNSQIENEINLF
jgi:hypothetical protein